MVELRRRFRGRLIHAAHNPVVTHQLAQYLPRQHPLRAMRHQHIRNAVTEGIGLRLRHAQIGAFLTKPLSHAFRRTHRAGANIRSLEVGTGQTGRNCALSGVWSLTLFLPRNVVHCAMQRRLLGKSCPEAQGQQEQWQPGDQQQPRPPVGLPDRCPGQGKQPEQIDGGRGQSDR